MRSVAPTDGEVKRKIDETIKQHEADWLNRRQGAPSAPASRAGRRDASCPWDARPIGAEAIGVGLHIRRLHRSEVLEMHGITSLY
jgi:hypothetical protein